jgi:hypothetical protein
MASWWDTSIWTLAGKVLSEGPSVLCQKLFKPTPRDLFKLSTIIICGATIYYYNGVIVKIAYAGKVYAISALSNVSNILGQEFLLYWGRQLLGIPQPYMCPAIVA